MLPAKRLIDLCGACFDAHGPSFRTMMEPYCWIRKGVPGRSPNDSVPAMRVIQRLQPAPARGVFSR